MKSNILRKLSGILLFIYTIPLSLADDDTIIDDTFRPNLKDGLLSLPPEILSLIKFAIGLVFVGVVAIIVIYTLIEALYAWKSEKEGDSEKKAEHIGRVFFGVKLLVGMIIAVLLIIYIASNLGQNK